MSASILVVGSGGREHALAWKLAQSPDVGKIFAALGNPGMEDLGVELKPYKADDITALADFAENSSIDLTVVGPEEPLAMGIVDIFNQRSLPIVGPTKAAAQLEASKAFAKDLMKRYDIPTADYSGFNNPNAAKHYVDGMPVDRCVVKASGLALGKGVRVCMSKAQARQAVEDIMVRKLYGAAGSTIVIEEMLRGPEASAIALVDKDIGLVFLPLAQDYKPVFDGDNGPNTGGMGSYSPVPAVDDANESIIMDEIITRTMEAMAHESVPFTGTAYAGVMLTEDGPKVLEFNIRFGDPETQPIMMRLKSDLLPYLEASTQGRLRTMMPMEIDGRAAVCVVLASGGYPGSYEKGKLITGLDEVKREFSDCDVMVFHAGTSRGDGGHIYTNGGRVLGVTALGDAIDDAAELAYEAANMIKFEGKYMRNDIGRDVMVRGRI